MGGTPGTGRPAPTEPGRQIRAKDKGGNDGRVLPRRSDPSPHPGLRRRGHARRLLDGALARAAKDGAKAVFLEVAEDNLAALDLYRACGFATIGRREGYYRSPEGRRIEAVTMRRDL